MDLKAAFVIVCLCVFTITSTEAGIPKCCITTKKHIPVQVLLKIQRWVVQQSSGACGIDAVILYVKDMRKPICAHPKVLRILKMQLQMKQKKQKASY